MKLIVVCFFLEQFYLVLQEIECNYVKFIILGYNFFVLKFNESIGGFLMKSFMIMVYWFVFSWINLFSVFKFLCSLRIEL